MNILQMLGKAPQNITKILFMKTRREDWSNDLPSKRMSFAIFIRDAEIVFTEPLLSTKASCAAYYGKKKEDITT